MHARRLLIGYLLFFIFSALGVYISGWNILINIWGAILVYCTISYLIYFIWKRVRYKSVLNYLEFFILFLYRSSLSIVSVLVILGTFSLYQNELHPAQLPLYVLSNGQKTLRFQTMSHVASSSFYKQVRRNVFKAKKENFIFFYEGVRPGSEKSTQEFNAALGIEFTKGLYDELSKLYGVIAQDNSLFLGLVNEEDYNIDLDLDTIMQLYDKKTSLFPQEKKEDITIRNIETLVKESVDSLTPRELEVLRYLNQALMNMIIKNEKIRDSIMYVLGKEDIFSVILDERNIHLVEAVNESSEENIFITYGLMHFEGVYNLLKEADPKWNIISKENFQVITRDE